MEDALRLHRGDELLDRARVRELAVEERDAALLGFAAQTGSVAVAAFDDVDPAGAGQLLDGRHAGPTATGRGAAPGSRPRRACRGARRGRSRRSRARPRAAPPRAPSARAARRTRAAETGGC